MIELLIFAGLLITSLLFVLVKNNKALNILKNTIKELEAANRILLERKDKDLKDCNEAKEKLLFELKSLNEKFRVEQDALKSLYEEELKKIKDIYNAELGHRKSSEVRLGRISETLAPFLNEWPWDPNDFRFLGNPIDGVQFTEDEVIFVEIKTGKSRLNDSQKVIRNLITNGKVSFAVFRLSESGSTLVKEDFKRILD